MSAIQWSKDPISIASGVTGQDLVVFPAPYKTIKFIYVNPSLNASIILQENSTKNVILQSDFRNMPLDGFYLSYELALLREFILTIVNRTGAQLDYYPTFMLEG